MRSLDPRLARHFAPQLAAGGHLLGLGYAGSISHNTHVPSQDPSSMDDIDLLGFGRWEHAVLQEMSWT